MYGRHGKDGNGIDGMKSVVSLQKTFGLFLIQNRIKMQEYQRATLLYSTVLKQQKRLRLCRPASNMAV